MGEEALILIRVAIVEDDPKAVELLRSYLDRYEKSAGVTVDVTVYADGAEAVECYTPIYDVLLLDIEMPHLDGMTAAGRIRAVDPDVIMIFITNMAKYAIKGYEVGALDFVLKPVSYFAFALKMDKVVATLQSREQRSLLVPTEDGMLRLSTHEITYIEVIDHQLQIHTVGRVYTMPGTLSGMEETLAGANFARCNKGYLVNLRHVAEMKGNFAVVGGEQLLISRRRREEFLAAVAAYYGGGGR